MAGPKFSARHRKLQERGEATLSVSKRTALAIPKQTYIASLNLPQNRAGFRAQAAKFWTVKRFQWERWSGNTSQKATPWKAIPRMGFFASLSAPIRSRGLSCCLIARLTAEFISQRCSDLRSN